MINVRMNEIDLLAEIRKPRVPPVREARLYLQLRKLGSSTKIIAERADKTVRYVQKRLKLLDGMSDDVVVALDSGMIKIAYARAIAKLPREQQRSALDIALAKPKHVRTAKDFASSLGVNYES